MTMGKVEMAHFHQETHGSTVQDACRAVLDGWTPDRDDQARIRMAAPDLLAAMEGLEPYLDAIICYASTMDEHEPNRLAFNARAAIRKARGGE